MSLKDLCFCMFLLISTSLRPSLFLVFLNRLFTILTYLEKDFFFIFFILRN